MSGTVGFAHLGFKQLFPLPSIVLHCCGIHVSLCISEINNTKEGGGVVGTSLLMFHSSIDGDLNFENFKQTRYKIIIMGIGLLRDSQDQQHV